MMRTTLLITFLGSMVWAGAMANPASAQSFPGGSPAHGRTIAEAVCSACHGPDGNGGQTDSTGVPIPRLAGQKAAYLYVQLEAFKGGGRRSAVMAPVTAGLSDADLADVASYLARRTVRPDTVSDAALASAGERIWVRGTAAVRPCVVCHGSGGTGMMGMMGRRGMMATMPPVPRLNGQHAAYTRAQLRAFASGTRASAIMEPIAAALTPVQVRAVAEYLAGLRGS